MLSVCLHLSVEAKKLLPWFDGMLEARCLPVPGLWKPSGAIAPGKADEAFFKAHGEPLFSSHMPEPYSTLTRTLSMLSQLQAGLGHGFRGVTKVGLVRGA